MPYRILTLVHAHSRESFGGTEHAAFALHHSYSENQDAWILTPGMKDRSEDSSLDLRIPTQSNPTLLTCTNSEQRDRYLKPILEKIKPQIIHLHHYIHFGIDVIQALKQMCPTTKIVLTLHEFLLICALDGQLLKRGNRHICTNPCPEACALCFNGSDQKVFEQRNASAQAALEACDGIISPSQWLLKQMQQQFQLPDTSRVIENGLPLQLLEHCQQTRQEAKNATAALNRFGFFGRASERKGLLLLLQACYQLTLRKPGTFRVQIHGGGLEHEPVAIQHRILTLIEACGDHIQLQGRYQQSEIPGLMQMVDWVIVPSIWWENSPVVIQEAFACRTPVIGSNHGGIAEKIIGRGGIGFQPNDVEYLSSRMAEAIGNTQLHDHLQEQIVAPFSIDQCASQHLRFYGELLMSHGRC